jgi:hypothetical protein
VACMTESCSVVGNIDIEPFVPSLISCIARPEEVSECVHGLAGTTFVQVRFCRIICLWQMLSAKALLTKLQVSSYCYLKWKGAGIGPLIMFLKSVFCSICVSRPLQKIAAS